MDIRLPEWAERAIFTLEAAGHEAYAVGGCVRDALLGCPIHDVDVATSAPPSLVKEVFAGFPVIETGIKHGTITVRIDRNPIEITTYRSDGSYADGRHPDSVSFGCSLAEDLARRDFTVNAMAYHPERGLVDRFGGREDLSHRLIRCVGDPQRRFEEDALRVLRALRFSSVLDFDIEPKTEDAIHALATHVSLVSVERITAELTRLLIGVRAGRILREFSDVIGVFLPEILPAVGFDQHNYHHKYNVLDHIAAVVDAAPADPTLRLAALLHDIAKPLCFTTDGEGVGHFYGHATLGAKLAEEILRRLRYDNRTVEEVTRLVRYHDGPIEAEKKAVRRKLARLGEENFFRLIALQRADCMGQADWLRDRLAHYDVLEKIAKEICAAEECLSVSKLAVNGHDLMAEGYQGRAIGEALRILLDAVLSEQVANDKAALLAFLKNQI
ncbi:MAG: HD domain-containing protein [Clostridia bacterium]|nr:HD domain-containing protein [Clostridia bacterium]